MPNWSVILQQIQAGLKGNPEAGIPANPHAIDTIRRDYLAQLAAHTGRNAIAYYSGWLQKRAHSDVAINDKDKNALMVTVHGMNRNLGLDLILHTPGGDLAATESMVDYLQSLFGSNIRAIIPQISMSAGTMIALSCKSIVMGKQSNLGPIDPQINGIPCQGVIAEFDRAINDIRSNPASAPLWQVIISKYHPTFLGTCQHAIKWSESLAETWLAKNMRNGDLKSSKEILKEFSDHNTNKSHARHISKEKCIQIGLTIEDMETDQAFQDLVLSVHHCFMHTFTMTSAIKIVENQSGVAYVEHGAMQMQQGPQILFGGQPVPMQGGAPI